MKILSLNYLKEDVDTSIISKTQNAAKNLGLNYNKTKDAVSTNSEYGNTVDKIATVNKYRGFDFFIKNVPNNQVVADINQTFIYTFLNDDSKIVALFPYVKQDLTLESPELIGFDKNGQPSYLSLELKDRNNIVHLNNYFNSFEPTNTLHIGNNQNPVQRNIFNFNITVGPNFDSINQKFKINNLNSLKNVNNINFNIKYAIKFTNITDVHIINSDYEENNKNRLYQLNISIYPYPNFNYTPNEQLVFNKFKATLGNVVTDKYHIRVERKILPTIYSVQQNPVHNNMRFITVLTKSNATQELVTQKDFFEYTKPNMLNMLHDGELALGTTPNSTFPIRFKIDSFRVIKKTI